MQITTGSSETMTPETLVLEQMTKEKEMIRGMKFFPVLNNFTSQEKRILKATGNSRVWLIATFFDKHLTEAGVQLKVSKGNYEIACDSGNGNHYPDPNKSEGGSAAESLDRHRLLLGHSNNRAGHLITGIEKFMHQLDKYGFCRKCGEPIYLERLEEVPHSSLCVPCKQRLNGK